MAYKVNYGLERAERNRAKQAKKEAKLRDRMAGVAPDEAQTPDVVEDPLATPEAEPEA